MSVPASMVQKSPEEDQIRPRVDQHHREVHHHGEHHHDRYHNVHCCSLSSNPIKQE